MLYLEVGKTYTIISKNSKDGSVETKDLTLCKEILNHYNGECRFLMSDGKEYQDIYKNRSEAISSYNDDLIEKIKMAEKEIKILKRKFDNLKRKRNNIKRKRDKLLKEFAKMKKELEVFNGKNKG